MIARAGRTPSEHWGSALTLGAVAATLAAPRVARRLDALPRSAAEGVVLLPALGGAYLGVAVLERLRPFRSEWNEPDGDEALNLGLLFVASPAYGLAAHAVTDLVARRIRARLGWQAEGAGPWPARWPLPARVALAVAVAEFGHYWHHRWSHEVPALWRYHALHHDVSRLSWINATRFHPLEMVPLVVVQDLPLIVAGIDPDARLAVRVLKGIHGMLQHANVPGRSPLLGRAFSTAEQHRLHHAQPTGARREAGVNYGAVLSVWDRVFGTYRKPAPTAFEGEVGTPAAPSTTWTRASAATVARAAVVGRMLLRRVRTI